MPDSFVKRKISVTFTVASSGLGNADSDADIITVTGRRCACLIQSAGMETGSIMNLRIEGMSLDVMNRISQVQYRQAIVTRNTVSVSAGDENVGMSEIFSGGITGAFVDFSGAPNVAFEVQAQANLATTAVPIDATSFKGPVKADDVFRAIAGKASLAYKGYGLTEILTDPVYPGPAAQQIDACARAIRAVYQIGADKLTVWANGYVPNSDDLEHISASRGLIGYPAYNPYGVTFDCLFNPRLSFWQQISIDSQYLPAAWLNQNGQLPGFAPSNGIWTIYNIVHSIQSETPDGMWKTTVLAETSNGDRPIYGG